MTYSFLDKSKNIFAFGGRNNYLKVSIFRFLTQSKSKDSYDKQLFQNEHCGHF